MNNRTIKSSNNTRSDRSTSSRVRGIKSTSSDAAVSSSSKKASQRIITENRNLTNESSHDGSRFSTTRTTSSKSTTTTSKGTSSKASSKQKHKKKKKVLSVFDRLSRAETFATADRKGKISRTNMDQTTKVLSPTRQRPVYTSAAVHDNDTNHLNSSQDYSLNSEYDRIAKMQRSKNSGYSNYSSTPSSPSQRPGLTSISTTSSSMSPLSSTHSHHHSTTPSAPKDIHTNTKNTSGTTETILSPERDAIAKIQTRIKASLSESSASVSKHSSQSSVITSIHQNGRKGKASPINEEEEEDDDDDDGDEEGEEEEEDIDELFNLIWNKQYIEADAYLNNSKYTTSQIRRALYYQNNDGFNPLMRALYKRPPKYITSPDSLIRQMIEIGGSKLVHQKNVWGNNALFMAIQYKRSNEIIQLFLDVGGGRDLLLQRNYKGMTILHTACEMNAPVDLVRSLVELGGKEFVLMEDDNGNIAKSKSRDVMDYLTKFNGDRKNKGVIPKHPSILHDMIQDKMYDEIETYLDEDSITLYGKRSAMAHQDKNGWTPLMFALLRQVPDHIIEQIIFIGGVEIVSIVNKYGNNALIYALAQSKPLDMIRLLVEKGGGGACIAQRYWEGLTPLHSACKYNASVDVIQYLVEEGQKFFEENEDYEDPTMSSKQLLISMMCHRDQTCLHKACANAGPSTNGSSSSLDVIKTLLDGCNHQILLTPDRKRKLPIHIACEQNAPLDVIKYLVSFDDITKTKESLTHEDIDGRNPLHLSCINGAPLEVVTYLANVGGRETIQTIPYRVRQLTHRGILLSYKSYTGSFGKNRKEEKNGSDGGGSDRLRPSTSSDIKKKKKPLSDGSPSRGSSGSISPVHSPGGKKLKDEKGNEGDKSISTDIRLQLKYD